MILTGRPGTSLGERHGINDEVGLGPAAKAAAEQGRVDLDLGGRRAGGAGSEALRRGRPLGRCPDFDRVTRDQRGGVHRLHGRVVDVIAQIVDGDDPCGARNRSGSIALCVRGDARLGEIAADVAIDFRQMAAVVAPDPR